MEANEAIRGPAGPWGSRELRSSKPGYHSPGRCGDHQIQPPMLWVMHESLRSIWRELWIMLEEGSSCWKARVSFILRRINRHIIVTCIRSQSANGIGMHKALDSAVTLEIPSASATILSCVSFCSRRDVPGRGFQTSVKLAICLSWMEIHICLLMWTVGPSLASSHPWQALSGSSS